MGILVEVNRHEEGRLECLEIVVEPYPYPISYRGQYHYRSGSTTQELKGPALSAFLLQKQGKRWDGVPGVTAADLSAEAFDLFRQRAAKSGRVDEQVLHDRNEALLDNLNRVDGDYLKRAAVLLFHSTPEKFIIGAYAKIGFFASDADLRYQDEVHGPLLLHMKLIAQRRVDSFNQGLVHAIADGFGFGGRAGFINEDSNKWHGSGGLRMKCEMAVVNAPSSCRSAARRRPAGNPYRRPARSGKRRRSWPLAPGARARRTGRRPA
jgi:hypothetical protein